MPHLNIQFSDNLVEATRMDEFCEVMNQKMQTTGIFPLGGIRVRAHAVVHYSIADHHPKNAFIDMVLRIGQGRTQDEKGAAGKALMETAETFFADSLSKPHLAISLEIVEIDKDLSWKTNGIHARLKNQK